MSRKAAVIEEVDDEFDDDVDLPLPPLPSNGPLLQELNEPALRMPSAMPRLPAHQPPLQSRGETSATGEQFTIDPVTGKKTIWIQDSSAYKMCGSRWTCRCVIIYRAVIPGGPRYTRSTSMPNGLTKGVSAASRARRASGGPCLAIWLTLVGNWA